MRQPRRASSSRSSSSSRSCASLFLFHLRSAFVAIVSLPLGVLVAFIVMHYQGINANIMSLGGIAIAIGAMVDAAVVMIENAHKHLERWQHEHPDETLDGDERWRVIGEAAVEVGPALFFSLLIITLSFIPVFTLEAQEGRLFAPLAFTKTYAMAAAAGLAVTLVPVLMGYLIRGRIPDGAAQSAQPRADRGLPAAARRACCAAPWLTLVVARRAAGDHGCCRCTRLGGEFMPPLDEGDLLYMPSALPGISAGKAARAAAADRPADQDGAGGAARVRQGRPRRDRDRSGAARDVRDHDPVQAARAMARRHDAGEAGRGARPASCKVPGLANIWVPPIRNRIDMLATGIKSPVGVKVAGADLAEIDRVAAADRARGEERAGRDLGARRAPHRRALRRREHRPRRGGALRPEHRRRAERRVAPRSAARTSARPSKACSAFRSTCAIRASCATRSTELRDLPIVTERGAQIRARRRRRRSRITDGPPMLQSENARLSGWVYVDIRGRDLQLGGRGHAARGRASR